MFSRPYHPDRYFAPRYFPSGAHSSLGYRVYRRPPAPGSARQLVATVAPGTSQLTLEDLAAYHDARYEVRAVSHCGVEDIEPLRLARVRTDGDAIFVGSAPNRITGLTLTPLPGGMLRAAWVYLPGGQAAAPGSFEVRAAVLPSEIDYEAAALATVASGGLREFRATLGPFSHGDVVAVNVQAVSAAEDGSVPDGNRLEVHAVIDTQPPEAASYITATATPSR